MSYTIYRIRSKSTGKFSPGGGAAKVLWEKGKWVGHANSKFWTNIGHLKNHLRMFTGDSRRNYKPIPEDWEVVEYIVTENSLHTNSAAGLVPPLD